MKAEADSHLDFVNKAVITYKRTLDIQGQTLTAHTERLAEVETRVEALEKLYGAQFVWKIDNYADKFDDSKNGRKSTIYSPPFLTSRHGYRVVMSACLYGDGKGKLINQVRVDMSPTHLPQWSSLLFLLIFIIYKNHYFKLYLILLSYFFFDDINFYCHIYDLVFNFIPLLSTVEHSQ